MTLSSDLQICLKAFIRRDYRRCATHAGAVMRAEGSLLIVQLRLISLQRLNQTKELALVIPEILRATTTFALDHSLVRLTLGHLDLQEVLDLSSDPIHRCRAHYYAGARALTCGDAKTALEHFRMSVSFDANCFESALAEVECAEIEKNLANPDWEEFRCLEDRAKALCTEGRYKAAVQAASKALTLCRQVAGESNPRCAMIMISLGSLHTKAGNYGEAEKLLISGTDVLREAYGCKDRTYLLGLNNLAWLYGETDRLREAVVLYENLLSAFEREDGEDESNLAFVLNNLGLVYGKAGRLVDAAKVLKRAIDIRRAVLGSESELLAASCTNLSGVLYEAGLYGEAEPYLREALDIKQRVLGERHPSYAMSANGLGLLFLKTGKLKEAEQWIRKALKVRLDTHGPNHGTVARVLNNLAFVRSTMGHFAEAESLLTQALEIRRTTSGEDDTAYSNGLTNLASICVSTDRVKRAWELYRMAIDIDDHTLVRIVSIGSERQRLEFLTTLRGKSDAIMSLSCDHPQIEEHMVSTAFDLTLRRKAVEAEVQAVHRDAILEGKYPKLESRLRELKVLRWRIAQTTLAGPGPEDLSTHQQRLTELSQKKERLEAELARGIPEMILEQKLRSADHRAVALSLPDGVALVEFVRFNVFDFTAVAQRVSYNQWIPPRNWKPARYLAFVLPAGEPDRLHLIDLGDADHIDRLLVDFLASITGAAQNQLGPDLSASAADTIRTQATHGTALRVAVFDKLVPAFSGCERLLLAPDGDLTRLPFEVLPTDDGRRLIDEYQISYVTTGRDVLRFRVAFNHPSAEPLVVADPDFDLASKKPPVSAPIDECDARYSRDLDRDLRFGRLPGTRIEGERIAAMLGVQPLLDADAVERRIKTCRSPRILHLATHGLFLADQSRDPNQEFCDPQASTVQEEGGMGRLSAIRLENPMLRSGLVFAGVNTWLKRGCPPIEAEDGLLTSEDVSGMDLLSTDLVVLSACGAGLGEIHVGEGVFGLRRAFVVAGAKTLVMSLWKVPDQQTQELMEDYYRRLLTGQGRSDALRDAQLALKDNHPDPLYWGAFICQGDPGPLPSQHVSVS